MIAVFGTIRSVRRCPNFSSLNQEKFDIKNMPYEVQLRIEKIISSLDEDIVNNSLFIDDFERRFFNLLSPNKIL